MLSEYNVVPVLRQLVTDISLWRPELSFRGIHVGFLTKQVAFLQDFLRVLQVSTVSYYSSSASHSSFHQLGQVQ